jgi:hypothetical protein
MQQSCPWTIGSGHPHSQLGVITVGAIYTMLLAAMSSEPRGAAPHHATLVGLTSAASQLLTPTVANPTKKS